MKISKSIKLLTVMSASALVLVGTSFANGYQSSCATAELLSGTATLGAGVLSPRSPDGFVLRYDSSDSAIPMIVYPINFAATVTAQVKPQSRTQGSTTTTTTSFGTTRVTNSTLINLIGFQNGRLGSPNLRLVYVTDQIGEAVDALDNDGLFISLSSNLTTGDLIPVEYGTTGVRIAFNDGLALFKRQSTFPTSEPQNLRTDHFVGYTPVAIEADGYLAMGVGNYDSTLARGLRFSPSLTNQFAYRYTKTSSNFAGLNDFLAETTTSSTGNFTLNTTGTFDASESFDFSEYSGLSTIEYSLENEGGLSNASIDSTTGVISFNTGSSSATYTPVVKAVTYFQGKLTTVYLTIQLTINVNPI
jgi:hypothetical protein